MMDAWGHGGLVMQGMTRPRVISPHGVKQDKGMRTVNAGRVLSLIDLSRQALQTARGKSVEPAGEAGAVSSVHVTAAGDVLVSSSASAGNEGDVALRGTIGAFPCALHLHLRLVGALATLELSVSQPFVLGPIAWRFELLAPVADTANNIVSASSVAAALESGSGGGGAMVREAHLGAWRFLNRAGDQVLPTLIQCLPSLAAGSDAYVACVVVRLGTHDAARIAEHLLGDDLAASRGLT
jgi:hypothetical protein